MKLRGLRQARQRRGLSIGQLAEATGLRRETIAHLEHGQEDPQPYAVRRLEAALDVGAEELFAGPVASSNEVVGELLPSSRAAAATRRPVVAR